MPYRLKNLEDLEAEQPKSLCQSEEQKMAYQNIQKIYFALNKVTSSL